MARSIGKTLCLLALVVLTLPGCASVGSGTADLPSAPPQTGALHVLDTYLASRLSSLEARAPSLGMALDSVRRGRLIIRLGTPEQTSKFEPWAGARMRPARLAQLVARFDTASGDVHGIVVQVDLKAIARHRLREIPPVTAWFSRAQRQARFDRLVDDVLIHEVWGHLVPLALAGNMGGACRDPVGGENEPDSCVLKRENALRAELGREVRRTYALADLW